jgi:hypothetical protein
MKCLVARVVSKEAEKKSAWNWFALILLANIKDKSKSLAA